MKNDQTIPDEIRQQVLECYVPVFTKISDQEYQELLSQFEAQQEMIKKHTKTEYQIKKIKKEGKKIKVPTLTKYQTKKMKKAGKKIKVPTFHKLSFDLENQDQIELSQSIAKFVKPEKIRKISFL